MIDLKKLLYKKLLPDLIKKNKLSNFHKAPFLQKIIVTSIFGEKFNSDEYLQQLLFSTFKIIVDQHPMVVFAKKSVSNFDIREKDLLGVKVTLRNIKLNKFLGKLFFTVIPLIDPYSSFLVNVTFDLSNNFTLGVPSNEFFPGVDYRNKNTRFGFDVIFNFKNKDLLSREFLLNFFL